jgi:hypothetical protein
MAKDETKRLKPQLISEDTTAYQAWQAIPGYQPNNPHYAATVVKSNRGDLESAQLAEAQAKAAYDAARDNAVKAEWTFHNLILGVKDQVASQFGRDSNEYQALGLKKKSERKPPTRKTA